MPYQLELPSGLDRRWKVKIFDNELLIEEPHVTVIFKTDRWRVSLRTGEFLDEKPVPDKIPGEVFAQVAANMELLQREWDARFPRNPAHEAEVEEE